MQLRWRFTTCAILVALLVCVAGLFSFAAMRRDRALLRCASAKAARRQVRARQADLLAHLREQTGLDLTSGEGHRLARDAAEERVRRWFGEVWRTADGPERELLQRAEIQFDAYLSGLRLRQVADLAPRASLDLASARLGDAWRALDVVAERYDEEAEAWRAQAERWEEPLAGMIGLVMARGLGRRLRAGAVALH